MKLLKWKIIQDKENNSMFYFFTNLVGRNTEYRLWVYRITNKVLAEK